MKVRLYKPQNAVLEKLIECFYSLRRSPEGKSVTYAAFPGVYSMICLNANASVEFFENNLTVRHYPNEAIETSLIINFDSPGLNSYEGAADEIVIYFKPLGLNAFRERDARDYATTTPPFINFAPFGDYRAAMKEIFTVRVDSDRIAPLEDYWLWKLRGFSHSFLSCVIDEMRRNAETRRTSITALTGRYNVSRPTLNKQFDRHICTRLSSFRKVVKFRKALAQHQNKFRKENLAAVSHEAEFFDQLHVIKGFKRLTNFAPKNFFSKISEIEEGQIIWLFL